ncbi:MAG TPA: thioredoxin family protein [Gaiellaceae bacterium]
MAADSRPLLVFFTSASSGPCRRMESLVAHIARKERNRLRVIQIDVDQRADLVQQLAVESVPTLVLIKDRKAVGRLDGRSSAPQIEAMLNQHLAASNDAVLVSAAAG